MFCFFLFLFLRQPHAEIKPYKSSFAGRHGPVDLPWVKPVQSVPQPQFSLQQNAHLGGLTHAESLQSAQTRTSADPRCSSPRMPPHWLRAKRRRPPADKWTELAWYTRFRTFHAEGDAPSCRPPTPTPAPVYDSPAPARSINAEVNARENRGRGTCPRGHANTG